MSERIFQSLKDLLQDVPRPLYMHEPFFDEAEKKYVAECLDAGWVSSAGGYVKKFGEDLGAYTKSYAIPTVNGTAALHLAFKLAGVEAEEEVFCPCITFVATANAIKYCHATPHFLNNSDGNFLYNIQDLKEYFTAAFEKEKSGLRNKRTGRLVRVLCVTHIFGFPAQMDQILDLCEEFNLKLVEDAAESLGSFYKGRHTGSFGLISATSFNGNKILTTGAGGAVLTPSKDLAKKALHLSTTARVADPYAHSHDEVGYNYRMPNINAALGCAQLEKLEVFLKKKERMASVYANIFEGFSEARFMNDDEYSKSNHWMHSLVLENEGERNALLDKLMGINIHCRGVWKPMHLLPMYQSCPKMDCSKSERLAGRTINFPSSANLIDYLEVA